MKRRGLILITILLSVLLTSASAMDNQVKGLIVNIEGDSNNSDFMQLVSVEVLEGPYKGQVLEINHSSLAGSSLDLRIDQRIIINVYSNEAGELTGYIISIDRRKPLLQLAIIFILAVLTFGRFKGLASLISLCISGVVVVKVLIPNILKGYSPVPSSVICAIIIIVLSFILISGFTRKSLAAILGTTGGTIIAGLLAHYYSNIVAIMATANDEAMFLTRELGFDIDFRGLLMAGIIIGTIGAVMDVSMSITSFIFELKKQSPRIGITQLMTSGLNIGKDVMATMINTLILAYAGASMPLFLIFFGREISFNYIINSEAVATEVIRSLCGSIGLILTIPLTVAIAALLAKDNRKTSRFMNN